MFEEAAISKTYGTAFYENGFWVLSQVAPHVALKLKKLFSQVPEHQTGTFRIKARPDVAADLEWFMSRYPFEMDRDNRELLRDQSNGYFEFQSRGEEILSPSWTPSERIGLKPGQSFAPYQGQTLDLQEHVKRLLVADQVGLGKTYEGLGQGLLPNALPMVAVVKPHLQQQWVEKAEEFTTYRVYAPKGLKPYNLPEADLYVFKYNQLGPWIDILCQGWVRAIAFDEIQELRRGAESAKGKAAKAFCEVADYVMGLTATLVYNYGIECFNIFDMMIPGILGTRDEFLREWCKQDGQDKGVVKDPEALGNYLREAQVMVRRRKQDVGQEVKQRPPETVWMDPDMDNVQSSQELAQQLAMKALTGSFQESGQAAREFDMQMRQMTGIAKARQVAQYVRMFLENGDPVLLFGFHREVYRIWAEELSDFNISWYTGSESPAQKKKSKDAFVNGESEVMIMSLRSAEGADGLQHACSIAVFGELDWSPRVHEQCIGRLDRRDQLYPVFVIYGVTDFGSDPMLLDVLGVKHSQGKGIEDPGISEEIGQADPDRIKNMARAYLKNNGYAIPDSSDTYNNEQPELADVL